MDKIKYGIIGCGRIAQRHAGHIKNFGVLVSAHDSVSEKAQKLCEEFGGTSYKSLHEFLSSDMDVVAVCSPNGLHAFHSIEALRSGFHVICEKPMALSAQDCSKMISAAEKADKRLFVVKQNRYNPAVSVVREKIEAGHLGKIFSVQLNCFWNRNDQYYTSSDWKGSLNLDGGTLFTQFSHFIDLLYWMVGDVKSVKGLSANFNHQDTIEFEDSGAVAVEFTNGAIGTINYSVNSFQRNMEGSITLFGEKGTVKIGGQYLNKLEYQEWEGEDIGELPPGNPANEYGEYQGSMSNHDKVYQNVTDVLLNTAKIATTGQEGKRVVEIIEMIYQAIK